MDEQRLQDYTNLLWQILTKTFESNGNPQVVYPLLEANLDKLDENFAQLWRNWKFVGLTAAVARISDLFRQFPLGNRSINLEIALAGYEKTLQVYTREAFPNEWAEIQLSLAETYSKRLCGEQAENLEQTLAYLQRALQVITREAFPERWAGIQFVIADIYKKRIRGERAENIEQAIACMEKALKVYIRDAFPERWVIILLSLADAYHARIRGEKLENQKQMIACLEGALQVYIREASPELWAQLQNFLASVYQAHLRGEQSDNLEQVLACIQNVLQVINREASPELWAQIQALLAQALLVSDYQARRGFSANNLEMDEQRLQEYLFFLQEVLQATFESNGNPKVVYPLLQENLDKLDDNFAQLLQRWATAIFVREPIDQALAIAEAIHNFSNLIRQFPLGSRASNLEIAIAGLETVLQNYSRDAFPYNWAVMQHNLAVAYRNRIQGEQAENLERAIAGYESALQVRTREAFPQEWPLTQNNLAAAYINRIQGERAENLERAIACSENALQVYNRESFPHYWAMTQNNLAIAYRERIQGGAAENLERAITCGENTLQVYTRESFPYEWAGSKNNLAMAYKNRIQGERTENLEQAIACYKSALQVFTRDAFPQDWGMTQEALADTYQERLLGEKVENLERAIAHYQKALLFFTYNSFPKEWAAIQLKLASAYRKPIFRKCADNLEQAIACYESALLFFTYNAFPEEWASIQLELANAYYYRHCGERAENLERAITGYETVLQVYTREAFPQAWALTQSNLANAYRDRIRGEKAENLERAITCCEIASQVLTLEAFPEGWARNQHNLANAYICRIYGDHAENLERAIRHYHKALQVDIREAFPLLWGAIQDDLGTAYRWRIEGNRESNLEQGIACHESALQVLTLEDFPYEWAITQQKLGNTYYVRVEGKRAENIEQAIAHYQNALDVYTRDAFPQLWAATQDNLADVYRQRIHGNRAENLEKAIAYCQAALQVFTPEAFPEDWAKNQNILGVTYRDCQQTSEAIASFQAALTIYTPTTFPKDCLVTGRNLGDTGFTAGVWSTAIQGYAAAIDAVEQSRTWATSELRRQEILAESIDIYANMVQACINNGQLDQAIEYVERSRSKRLIDLMASNDLYSGGEIPPEVQQYLQQFEDLQQQIDKERFNNDADNQRELVGVGANTRSRAALGALKETIATLEAHKQQVWQKLRQLDPVLAGQIQVSAPDLAAMQQLIDQPTTAILSFYTTRNDTHIFVLRQEQIALHTCAGLGLGTLQNWISEQWLRLYIEDKNTWRTQLSSVLAELAERLQITDLITQHFSGLQELILVPHLYLHQIPFAALPIGDSQYLGDDFLIRYIPSCQILEFCQKRPPVGEQLAYGTVEDATEDLPCSSFEGEKIAQLYNIPENQRLRGRHQATVSNYRQLVQQAQGIISTHHAQSRLDNPLESHLVLADGTITLGQLLTPAWRLPHLEDVFLSCCETHLGVAPITDDILTLSTGFLCAGARSVVSTLWAVDDLATALFSILYHRYRQQNISRPAALQQAQLELRSLTGQELSTRYKPELTELLERKFEEAEAQRQGAEDKLNEYLEDSTEYLQWEQEHEKRATAVTRIYEALERLEKLCQESFPFSHPFYWAAFTCSGLRSTATSFQVIPSGIQKDNPSLPAELPLASPSQQSIVPSRTQSGISCQPESVQAKERTLPATSRHVNTHSDWHSQQKEILTVTFEEELDIYLRSRFTLLVLVTPEEERVLEIVKGLCERSGRYCLSWDLADGFRSLTKQADPLPSARDPLTALEQVDKADGSGLFVLKDFHECWSNAQYKRKLKSVAQRLKFTKKSILITSPYSKIPAELKDEVVVLEFPLPNTTELEAVLNRLTQTPGVKVNLTPLGKEKLVQAALGLTASQAQRVLAKAIVSDGVLDDRDIDLVTEEKKQIIRESQALEFYAVHETADDVGGLGVLKEWLRLRERAFTQEARDYGLPWPKGIALIGIPGTGKSLTAKMIGGLWRLPLLRLDIGALFGSLVGESEERTRRALKLAETVAPCILWIDEIEKGFAAGGLDGGTSKRVFGTILTWMQEKTAPSFVVATANDIASLPPELLRKGRFDEIFFLDLPTLTERQEIFTVHLHKRHRLPQDFDIAQLARESEGYVGSEIEQAIIDAMYVGFNAEREFTREDIRAALKRQVPLSKSQRETIEALRNWLREGRAQSASFQEIREAERQFVPLQLDIRR